MHIYVWIRVHILQYMYTYRYPCWWKYTYTYTCTYMDADTDMHTDLYMYTDMREARLAKSCRLLERPTERPFMYTWLAGHLIHLQHTLGKHGLLKLHEQVPAQAHGPV